LTTGASAAFNIVTPPIFSNPITGTNPNTSNPYTNGQTFDANISVSGIGRGAGASGTNANNRYNANSWDTVSLDPTAYFEFVLTPVAGYQIDFTNFVYTAQASGSGATSVVFRSSVDGFTANIGTATLTGTTISLTDTAFQNVSSGITFRVYAWGASNSTGTFSIDSFEFNGLVEASPLPQISAAPATISGLNYFEGAGPSASQTISVTGANLTPAAGDLTASVTAGFEVSTDNTNFSSSVNVAYTGGSLTNVPVYVRQIAGTSAGDYSGTVTISGGGAPVDASVNVSGKVVIPFDIPFFNSFTTQADVDDAIAKGFVASAAAFNTSYLRFNSIGAYLETPVIDFTQESDFRVQFEAATFGGNNNQVLELQISTDGGSNYTPLATVAPTSGTTYSTLTYDIDVASYPSTNGKIRVIMTAGTSQTRFRNFYLLGRTTWDGTSWSNGAPNSLVAATIDGDYSTSGEPSINAFSLNVSSGILTVTNGESVTLQNALTVNTGATAEFESNANLIQVNNVSNTGSISISRTANMRRQDYIYWSSPVTGQNLFSFSDQTLSNRFYVLDEETNSFKALFTATPAGLGENAGTYNFIPTNGYMVRAPNNHPSTVSPWTGTFTGVPNNGTYTFQATNGVSGTAAGNNLIGNPYPSPINANSFLAANPTVGTLYFWAHITQTAPGAANYASYNGTGAAAAAGGEVPNGTIQVGQGFLVTVPAAVSIVFNNGMRVNNHQNQFFRSSENGVTGPERHRIWLDLKKDGTVMSQSLLGYVSEATNGIEPLYDGAMIPENAPQLYSVIDNQAYSIQGRALPFADSDIVPMGIKTPTAGNYVIALNSFDGLFGDQAVYLKDNATNVLHDIKSGDYTFAADAGTFNDRFQIVFNTTTLGTDQPVLTDNAVTVYKNGTSLEVNAGTVDMQSVKIFDIRGRLVASRESINATSTSFANLSATQQVLLVQIVSKDGTTVTKKVIF
ncbi:MAG TPA: T9SS sorting signal type C domain-containing protein, partial [Flavobacterium sp.]|nr:T9SS sorting signal type C domain-containing protein [Flavobacterium sp.]